jgi:hypothetical protein
MSNMFRDTVTNRIADFLNEIGIGVEPVRLNAEGFLPGILVKGGRLLVGEAELSYPGDLLHEAGHLAVAPGDVRPSLGGKLSSPVQT